MEQRYIDGSPMVELLSDKDFVSGVRSAIMSGRVVHPEMYSNDFVDIASTIGFLLPTIKEDVDYYNVNQCHELYELFEHPHSDRLTGDRCTVGLLNVMMDKTYIQCIPMDSFEKYTGFESEEIESNLQELKHLRLVESTLIIKGEQTRNNVVENADKILSRIDNLKELLTENESVSTDKIRKSVGGLETPDEDEDAIISMTEDEFMYRMKEAIKTGQVHNITTPKDISKLEEGTRGYRINNDSELVQTLMSLEINLTEYVDEIREYIN